MRELSLYVFWSPEPGQYEQELVVWTHPFLPQVGDVLRLAELPNQATTSDTVLEVTGIQRTLPRRVSPTDVRRDLGSITLRAKLPD